MGLEWLGEHSAGRCTEVAAPFTSVADVRLLERDLERVTPKFLEGPADRSRVRRRVLAAFALEAASARVVHPIDAT